MKYSITNAPFAVLNLKMEASCSMEIVTIKGFTNIVVGGEGLFNTVLTGPGKVWQQTTPLYSMASAISPYIVRAQ